MSDRVLFKKLRAMHRRIFLMIAKGALKLVYDGHGLQRIQTGGLADELRDRAERFQDYGITSFPLPGAEVLFLSHGGNRDHPIAVRIDDRRYRPVNGKAGDVSIYHFRDDREAAAADAKHRITLTEDGGDLTAVIRCDRLDIKCGRSELVMDDAGIRIKTPDFQMDQP